MNASPFSGRPVSSSRPTSVHRRPPSGAAYAVTTRGPKCRRYHGTTAAYLRRLLALGVMASSADGSVGWI
jgi:hypothetical protein